MAYAAAPDLNALVQGEIPAATAELLLDLASGEVDHEVGRPLAATARTDEVDGYGRDTVWLHWPVAEITSVEDDGAVLDPDNYRWRRSGQLTRRSGTARWCTTAGRLLTVTYTCGFPADAPELLTAKRIVLEVASRVAANPQALTSLTADGVAAAFGAGFAFDDRQRADLAKLTSRLGRP